MRRAYSYEYLYGISGVRPFNLPYGHHPLARAPLGRPLGSTYSTPRQRERGPATRNHAMPQAGKQHEPKSAKTDLVEGPIIDKGRALSLNLLQIHRHHDRGTFPGIAFGGFSRIHSGGRNTEEAKVAP